jgi:hypothetical protein
LTTRCKVMMFWPLLESDDVCFGLGISTGDTIVCAAKDGTDVDGGTTLPIEPDVSIQAIVADDRAAYCIQTLPSARRDSARAT